MPELAIVKNTAGRAISTATNWRQAKRNSTQKINNCTIQTPSSMTHKRKVRLTEY